MKKEIDLRQLYQASFRCAIDMANQAGVSKRGRKKFINDNTSATYNDCKNNAKLRKWVLKKYGK